MLISDTLEKQLREILNQYIEDDCKKEKSFGILNDDDINPVLLNKEKVNDIVVQKTNEFLSVHGNLEEDDILEMAQQHLIFAIRMYWECLREIRSRG